VRKGKDKQSARNRTRFWY